MLHWEKNGIRIGSDRGNLTKLPKIGGSDFLGLVEHYVRMVIQRLLRLWLPDWGNSVRIVEIHAAAGVIGLRRISIFIRQFPQPEYKSPWSEWGKRKKPSDIFFHWHVDLTVGWCSPYNPLSEWCTISISSDLNFMSWTSCRDPFLFNYHRNDPDFVGD